MFGQQLLRIVADLLFQIEWSIETEQILGLIWLRFVMGFQSSCARTRSQITVIIARHVFAIEIHRGAQRRPLHWALAMIDSGDFLTARRSFD